MCCMNSLLHKLTTSMEQSVYLEADSGSVNKEIPSILYNPKIHDWAATGP
jgi:hypothetical protein